MSNINPYWNSIFYIVAKTKSFTKASEKLEIKKSTVSRNIDLLENELNTTLFYRDNKGVSLTSDGKLYFEYVEQGINLFDAGEKLVKANNNIETGEMTIGALSHISHFYLIDRLAQIKKDYPKMKITLLTGSTGKELINMLENHKIDFALDSTTMQIKNKDIEKEKLKEIGNIFVSKEPVVLKTLKELENQKLILGQENTTTSQTLVELMKENNVIIKADFEIDTTELKVDATKSGVGIAYVMRDAVKKEIENKTLYEVKLPIKLPSSSINLLYLKGQLSTVDKKFIKDYLKK